MTTETLEWELRTLLSKVSSEIELAREETGGSAVRYELALERIARWCREVDSRLKVMI